MFDRDRQSRSDRKQIEHFEQETRRIRIELKETQMRLNEMEGTKMNVEKEKEQLIIDLKSVQKRLENEKARYETCSGQLAERELELAKSKEIVNYANKQIKNLDLKVHQGKAKRRKLKECL